MACYIPKLLVTNGSFDRLPLKFNNQTGFYNSSGPFEVVASGTSSFTVDTSLKMASNGVVNTPCISHSNDSTSGIWKDSCVNFSSIGTKVSSFCSDGLFIGSLYQNSSILCMKGTADNVMNANNLGLLGFDTIVYQYGAPFATYVGDSISGSFIFTVPGYYFVSASNRVIFTNMTNNKDRRLQADLYINGSISRAFQSRYMPIGLNNYTSNLLEVAYITSSLSLRGTTTVNDASSNRTSRERNITILRLF